VLPPRYRSLPHLLRLLGHQ